MRDAVAVLRKEQEDLEDVLRSLSPEQWALPTPAAGWDVRDQVSHLADTEEIACDSVSGGPRNLNKEAARFQTPDEFTLSGCLKGRGMDPPVVLDWWVTAAARTRTALEVKDPKDRVPWGLGMSARAFVTARVMETWAHGLDIRAAAGLAPNVTPRLQGVAWIIVSSLPYAFGVAKRERPAGDLRVELDAPGGERWVFGPETAESVIIGEAGEFCRLGVQRMPRAEAHSLRATGPLADAALDVVRAFL